jgi:hypothetical protein
METIKNVAHISHIFYVKILLYRFGHSAGTQASGTNIHAFGNTVNSDLDLLYIRLPDSVTSSMRVTDFYAEMLTLFAYFALCHL